jgi:hypothetical protein
MYEAQNEKQLYTEMIFSKGREQVMSKTRFFVTSVTELEI